MAEGITNQGGQKFERQELAKSMRTIDYFTLGFGAMVGVGWVITVGDWVSRGGGPLGAILAFALGGLLLLPVGFAIGELTAALPVTGGGIVYAYRAFGTTLSFYTGWFLALAYIGLCPWEAIAIGRLLGVLVPALKTMPLYEMMGFTVYAPLLIIDLAIAGFIIYLNFKGVEKAATFQTLMTYFLMTTSVIFIITGFVKGDFANLVPLWTQPEGQEYGPVGGMLAVLAITPFFMAGFDTITQGAEESGEGVSYDNLGKMLSLVIFSGIVFYALAILAVSMVVPWQTLADYEFPAADAFMQVAPVVATIVLLGALAGLVTTFNAFFLGGARILFALARARMLPAWFAKIHEATNIPINAVIFIAVLTVIGPFIGTALILPLVDVGSFAFIAAWFIMCASSWKLRQTEPNLKRPFKMPGGSSMAVLAMITSGIMTISMLIPGAPGMLVWPLEWIITVGWLLLGSIFFVIAKPEREKVSEEERRYLMYGDFANSGQEGNKA